MGRAVDRVPLGTLPRLVDDGAMPNQVMRGITRWGVRPISAPTTDERYSDCEAESVNDEPTLTDLVDAAEVKITGYYRIDSLGSRRVDDICVALDCGYAVCMGVFVDAAFEEWNPDSGPLGTPDTGDPHGGGHYICALGYRSTVVGDQHRRIFIFRNSWGRNWGIVGNGEGDEAFIAGASDIYVMSIAMTR